ncbi:hypothetical protein EVAR_30534_1 [Eumeta japonica]|uniref:Cation efflux protein transmembrane domain-containing protein n=1 Tax=Eumeta variegata TaxID=151549 RepID=A0A4C1VYN0_EUMVA|nr:hypothetical protein EVAR_30534_1 [Eumeta japonica]
MGRYTGKKCRLLSMLWLTGSFFVIELVVGYVTNSMALVADSFHMLSDVAALVVAFLSVKMSPKKWSKNTFGWARAEVLGALVNAVFLVALCFSIVVEAMKRFTKEHEIHEPELLVAVGTLGLLVNIVGLFLFHVFDSSPILNFRPGSLSDSDSGYFLDFTPSPAFNSNSATHPSSNLYQTEEHGSSHTHSHSHGGHITVAPPANVRHLSEVVNSNANIALGHNTTDTEETDEMVPPNKRNKTSSNQTPRRKTTDPGYLNMKGVFLHVLSDALEVEPGLKSKAGITSVSW